jgi:alpha-L-rhamnosidase
MAMRWPMTGRFTRSTCARRATDEFVLAGGAPAALEPRFTLHGFRYAEITGYPGELSPEDAVARVAHSDIALAPVGRVGAAVARPVAGRHRWGQRGNFISVPTDCPQRDVAAFFGKWLGDVADAQHPSGAYPDIAPRLHIPWAGAPAWAGAGVIVPWTVWKMDGDLGVLERHHDGMARWMGFVGRPTPTSCGPATRATATTTGSPPAVTTRRASCSRPRTGPTTRP